MTVIKTAHHPGQHCASTGLCNLVRHQGIPWTEAMCFGLGAGLGIWYIDMPGITPSRMIHVRSLDIEAEFFSRIGHPFRWEQYPDPVAGERALCEILDSGRPVILQTDIYYLPHYDSSTHYPGHVVTVWGYSETEKVFYISDTGFEPILEVSFDQMRKARFCEAHLLSIKGNLFAATRVSLPHRFKETLRKAILTNSRRIVNGMPDLNGIEGLTQGLSALEKWISEIPGWQKLDDRQWACRFTYQVIEKRGTGGCGFRRIYADFLDEAQTWLPDISSRGLPQMMRSAAAAWQDLALALKAASERTTPDMAAVTACITSVLAMESVYHHAALGLK